MAGPFNLGSSQWLGRLLQHGENTKRATLDSATQSRRSWLPEYPLNPQDGTAQPSAEIIHEAPKFQIL
jgi:hypothetical protein